MHLPTRLLDEALQKSWVEYNAELKHAEEVAYWCKYWNRLKRIQRFKKLMRDIWDWKVI